MCRLFLLFASLVVGAHGGERGPSLTRISSTRASDRVLDLQPLADDDGAVAALGFGGIAVISGGAVSFQHVIGTEKLSRFVPVPEGTLVAGSGTEATLELGRSSIDLSIDPTLRVINGYLEQRRSFVGLMSSGGSLVWHHVIPNATIDSVRPTGRGGVVVAGHFCSWTILDGHRLRTLGNNDARPFVALLSLQTGKGVWVRAIESVSETGVINVEALVREDAIWLASTFSGRVAFPETKDVIGGRPPNRSGFLARLRIEDGTASAVVPFSRVVAKSELGGLAVNALESTRDGGCFVGGWADGRLQTGPLTIFGEWGAPARAFLLKVDSTGVPNWIRDVGPTTGWQIPTARHPSGDVFVATNQGSVGVAAAVGVSRIARYSDAGALLDQQTLDPDSPMVVDRMLWRRRGLVVTGEFRGVLRAAGIQIESESDAKSFDAFLMILPDARN